MGEKFYIPQNQFLGLVSPKFLFSSSKKFKLVDFVAEIGPNRHIENFQFFSYQNFRNRPKTKITRKGIFRQKLRFRVEEP